MGNVITSFVQTSSKLVQLSCIGIVGVNWVLRNPARKQSGTILQPQTNPGAIRL